MDLIVKNVSEAGEPVLSLVEEKCLGFFGFFCKLSLRLVVPENLLILYTNFLLLSFTDHFSFYSNG